METEESYGEDDGAAHRGGVDCGRVCAMREGMGGLRKVKNTDRGEANAYEKADEDGGRFKNTSSRESCH